MMRTQECALQDRFGGRPKIRLDCMSNQMHQNFTVPLFLATAILLWLISNFATFMHATDFNAPKQDSESQRVLTVYIDTARTNARTNAPNNALEMRGTTGAITGAVTSDITGDITCKIGYDMETEDYEFEYDYVYC